MNNEQSIISHLLELRDRLLRCVIAVVVLFVGLFAYPGANQLYTWLAKPLLEKLPKGGQMIATEVTTPFFVPMKVTGMVAFLIALPFILYQFWRFVAPGMYAHEKRFAFPVIVSGTLLFSPAWPSPISPCFRGVRLYHQGLAGRRGGDDRHQQVFGLRVDVVHGLRHHLRGAGGGGAAGENGLGQRRQAQGNPPLRHRRRLRHRRNFHPARYHSQFMLAVPLWLLYELGIVISGFISKPAAPEEEPYRPLDEVEMDAEFDRMEAAEKQDSNKP